MSVKVKTILSELKKIALVVSNEGEMHNHPAVIAAEETGNDALLQAVSELLLRTEAVVAEGLNKIASKFDTNELTMAEVEEIAVMAQVLDTQAAEEGDDLLKKQASVLDQILLNFAQEKTPKAARDEEIERLRSEYRAKSLEEAYKKPTEEHERDIRAAESAKLIGKSIKEFRPLEHTLSIRTCPEHPGAQMSRVADGIYQCSMDKSIYNWNAGFTTQKGNKVPGGQVTEQTQALGDRALEQMHFSTRESALQR